MSWITANKTDNNNSNNSFYGLWQRYCCFYIISFFLLVVIGMTQQCALKAIEKECRREREARSVCTYETSRPIVHYAHINVSYHRKLTISDPLSWRPHRNGKSHVTINNSGNIDNQSAYNMNVRRFRCRKKAERENRMLLQMLIFALPKT